MKIKKVGILYSWTLGRDVCSPLISGIKSELNVGHGIGRFVGHSYSTKAPSNIVQGTVQLTVQYYIYNICSINRVYRKVSNLSNRKVEVKRLYYVKH